MTRGKRNLVLVILSLIAGLVYLTPFLRFSFYDQMARALQLTDLQIGSIGGIYGFFNVATYVPSGFLAERFNTKKLLILSTLGMALTTLWYATFPGYTALLVIHALFGVFSVGTFWSPYLKAVRSLGPDSEQGRLFGISEGLRGVAQTAVAFVCLGALARIATVGAGFRALLLINAGVFVALMVAVIFLVPDLDKGKEKAGAPAAAAPREGESMAAIVLGTLKSPSTWLCVCVIFCGYTLWNTVNIYAGTYCTRVLHISEDLSSLLSIIRSYFIVFLAGFSGGFIIDNFSTKGKGLGLAFLLAGACAAGVYFSTALVALCLALTIVLGYLVNVVKATYWSIMGEAGVPAERTGMATGIISLVALTPDIIVPLAVSRFLDYGENVLGSVEAGFNIMLAWLVAWSALGVVAALALKKRAEARK